MINNSFSYSVPYVAILLILLLLAFLESKLEGSFKFKVKIIAFSIFFFFYAFRGFVGSDFTSYYLFYKDLPDFTEISFKNILDFHFEPGFVFFSSIIKIVSSNYHFYIFFNTLIDTFLISIILRRYSNSYFILSLVIFFVFCGEMEINLLRNIKSILFFLISLKYLLNRQWFPYFVLNLIGLTFHSTAIFFLPLYFFLHRSSKFVFTSVFLLGSFIYFLQIKYVNFLATLLASKLGGIYLLRTEYYLESESSGITLAVLYIIIPFIFVLLNYNKIIARKKHIVIFVNMFLLYCIANLYFTEILVFRARFGYLFVFSLCIIIPEIFAVYNNSKVKSFFLVNIVSILLFSKIIITNTPLPNYYDNLFFGIMSYEKRIDNMNSFSDIIKY